MYQVLNAVSFVVFFALLRWRMVAEGIETLDRSPPNRAWLALEVSALYFASMTVGAFLLATVASAGRQHLGAGRFGGYAIFLLALVPYLSSRRVPRAPVLDGAAVALPFAMTVAKLGCLAAGCCYGTETAVPWAVTYRDAQNHAPVGVPIHPTQAYDAAVFFVAAVVAAFLTYRDRLVGKRLLAVLVVMGAGRAVTEAFRGDTRPALGPLSIAQVVAIVTAISSAALLAVPQLDKGWQRLVAPDGRERFLGAADAAVARLHATSDERPRPPRGGVRGHVLAVLRFVGMYVVAGLAWPVIVAGLLATLSQRPPALERFRRLARVEPWLWFVVVNAAGGILAIVGQPPSLGVSPAALIGYLGFCGTAAIMLLVGVRRRMPPEYRGLRAAAFV
jgi:hypothetical protein